MTRPKDENLYRIFPFSPIAEPIPPPSVDHDDAGTLVRFCVSQEYIPYLITAASLFTYSDMFSGSDAENELAARRFKTLIAALSVALEGCNDVFDIRLVGCVLQKSNDGGLTWEDVVDLTECTVPGPPGEPGAGIDSVEVTTLEPGSSATATLTDGVLELGIPRGSDGIDGTNGTNGTDCDCVTEPPTTPEIPTDQRFCNMAGYLAQTCIKKALEYLIQQATDAKDPFQIIGQWLEDIALVLAPGIEFEEGKPKVEPMQWLPATRVYMASWLIKSIAVDLTPYLEQYETAVADADFFDAVTCAIYDALVANNGLNTASLGQMGATIIDLPFGYTSVQETVVFMLDELGVQGLADLSLASVLIEFDCGFCDPCRNLTWDIDDVTGDEVEDFTGHTDPALQPTTDTAHGGSWSLRNQADGSLYVGASMYDLGAECTITSHSVWIKVQNAQENGPDCTLTVRYYEADHTYIGQSYAEIQTDDGDWHQRTFTTDRANCRYVYFSMVTTVSAGHGYLDDFVFTRE